MKKMTIIGIVIIAVGFILGAGLFGGGITLLYSKDPANENVTEITTNGGDAKDLKKGDYLVWYEGDIRDITVRGPDGLVEAVEVSSDTVEYDDIQLYGKMKAKETGDHRFEYAGQGKLYITEEFTVGTYKLMMYGGGGAGILIMLIGIVLIVFGKLRQKKSDHSSFFQEIPAQPGPAPGPAPIDQEAGKP